MLYESPGINEKLFEENVSGGSLFGAIGEGRIMVKILPESTSVVAPLWTVRHEPKIVVKSSAVCYVSAKALVTKRLNDIRKREKCKNVQLD